MTKLTYRYSPEEKAKLLACIKPVERWTRYEQQLWARSHYGFRHFIAPNVTPIEHYRPPEPGIRLESFDKPRSPRKPAA